jgi:general L-amino acid transport system permease protein
MSTTTAPNRIEPTSEERPSRAMSVEAWLRKNLFRSWFDTLLTIVVGVGLVWFGIQFVGWLTSDAQWIVITDNFRGIMQGLYPIDQGWRLVVAVIMVMILAGLSWGVWGRMFASASVILGVGALIFIAVPLIDPQRLGHFGNQMIPLLRALQLPILATLASMAIGYALGRGIRTINRKLAGRVVSALWLLSIPATFILVRGLSPQSSTLPVVPTNQWGGLLLTFMMAFIAIVCSFPIGILLALGRTSSGTVSRTFGEDPSLPQRLANWWRSQGHYPIIKVFCVVYIEFMRGIPLVTVFFAANYIVPFALGIQSNEIDAAVKAMVGLTLFEAAYIAEIVRGGLQAMPPGQMEAAKAVGLNSIQAISLIILPQALRVVIPALVGQFITMFKDTSLVVLVGLLELLGTVQSLVSRPEYSESDREALLFTGLVYFVFSYGMSLAARQLERRGSGALRRTG